MTVSHGHLYEHAKLGTVVMVGEVSGAPGKVRVAVHSEWRETPITVYGGKRRGGAHINFPVKVHVVDRDELRDRPRHDADVERFMREHHDPRWKPKPLPKFRALPKLSDEKFRKLMLDNGARQTSE